MVLRSFGLEVIGLKRLDNGDRWPGAIFCLFSIDKYWPSLKLPGFDWPLMDHQPIRGRILCLAQPNYSAPWWLIQIFRRYIRRLPAECDRVMDSRHFQYVQLNLISSSNPILCSWLGGGAGGRGRRQVNSAI